MKYILFLILSCFTLTAHAQEAVAINPQTGQSSNTSLNKELDTLETLVTDVETRLSSLKTCNDAGRIYAPTDSDADVDGCIAAVSPIIPKFSVHGDSIRTTGRRTRDLGEHTLCYLNKVAGPGGLDTWCTLYVDEATNKWTLNTGDVTSAETHQCGAICIDVE